MKQRKVSKLIKISFVIILLCIIGFMMGSNIIVKIEKQRQIKQQATSTSVGFLKISSGEFHNLAIDVKGNLWSWGWNESGQLGDGTTTDSNSNIIVHKVKAETTFTEIATGNRWSLAIDSSGNLWGWGLNDVGQLGNGTTTNSSTPIQIKAGTKFQKISAGGGHCLAIDTSGNLWGWGHNSSQQVNSSTETPITTPVKIKSGTTFKEIAAGSSESFAIDSNGNLWAWGHNGDGRLGNGTTTNSSTPIQIKAGTKFQKVSAKSSGRHTLAIDTSGNLWAWGYNGNGQLGNGGTGNASFTQSGNTFYYQTIPTQIKAGTKFKEISAGRSHSMAIDSSGNLWAWGRNSDGELGTGNVTTTGVDTPVQVKAGSTFTAVSAGVYMSMAMDSDKNLWASGKNMSNQFGDGSAYNSVKSTFTQIPKVRVSFNSSNATTQGSTSAQVTYGAAMPSINLPKKTGYTFAGYYSETNGTGTQYYSATGASAQRWDRLENSTTLYANWTASTNTAYKVEHYQQNTAKTGYTLKETENKTGTTDTTVTATKKTYTGFTENTTYTGRKASGTVAADGSLVLKLYYDRSSYNVTLNANGGTIASGSNVTSYVYGVEKTLPTPTKTGYTFAGWYTTSSLTGTAVTKITTTDSGAKTYYAKYTANTNTAYKVEHYQQNTTKTGYTLKETENKTGTTGATATATAKTYTGFTENTSYSGRKASGTIAADGSLVLKLYYNRNSYNVTLNANGGTIASGSNITSYTYGVGATLPTPTSAGYTFDGWYTTSTFTGTKVTAISTTDSGAKTYYAKYTANTNTAYKVEHYQQNTAKTGYTLKETENETGTTGATATATAKTYTGFTENTTYSERKASGSIAGDGSLVLKLYYDRNTYNITLNANGGTIPSGSNITNYVYGVEKTLPTPTKTGYTFGGWYTASNLTGTAVTQITATDTGAKNYYAKWNASTNTAYTIEHYKQNTALNGYDLITTDTESKTGTTDATVTATAKTYTGFTENTTYSERKASGTVAADGSLVLKLYYDRNSYNVTLNTNGGSIASGSEVTNYIYGIEKNLPTPTKTGYAFAGWYTNSNLTGNAVTVITTTDTGAKTYYAKWTAGTNTAYKVEHYKQNTTLNGYELVAADTQNLTGVTDETVTATARNYTGFTENTSHSERKASGIVAANGSLVLKLYYDRSTYNVTLNANGGNIGTGNNITSYVYGVEKTLPTPTKAGYTFAGWYTNSNLTGNAVTKISSTDSGAKTYYAKWIANTDTTYKVEHYQQNVAKTGYTLKETESKTGTTEEEVTATAKTYTGFTENTSHSERKANGTIAGDGSLVLKLYYDRNSYSVTLNANGGSIPSGSNITSYTYGNGAKLPVPSKDGYIFNGWYTNLDLTGTAVTLITTTDTGAKTYYAKWEASTNTAYKVEHYKQNTTLNGYDLVIADTENKTGTTGEAAIATAKEYPGFSENTTISIKTGTIEANGSLVLKIYYDRNHYQVTLDPNGGTLPEGTETIDYTHGIEEELPTPEKEGYTFAGWYDNEDLEGEPVDKINPEDIGEKELHAKWEAKTDTAYRVEHYKQNTNLNGYDIVTADTESKTGTTGEAATATAKEYPGFSENTTISIKTGTIEANGSLVLKIYYDRNTYNIKLNPDGGTLPEGKDTIDYTHGIEEELPTPEKEGYTFEGWYDNEDLGGEPVDKINPEDIGEKELHAKWEARTDIAYKVEHYKQNTNLNGYDLVSSDTENKTGTTGTTVTAIAKEYSGFSENTTISVKTGTILGNGSLVLRVYYDRNHYQVTLDPNGGTLPEGTETIDYTHGIEKELPTPEKEGYTFGGWYDNEDLEGEPVDKINPEEVGEKEFFAKWEANSNTPYRVEHYKQNTTLNGYDIVTADSENKTGITGATATATAKEYPGFSENTTLSEKTGTIEANGSLVLKIYYDRNHYQVTLDPNGGTLPEGTETIDYTHGIEEELPTPEKEGYTFGGWYDNEDLEGDPIDKIKAEDVGEKEFYAKWEAKTDTAYKVEHYKQNTALNGYDMVITDTENKTGTTGTTVTATAKPYEGFSENTALSQKTGTITGDGSLVLKIYYDRSHYSIKLNPDGGTLPEGKDTIDYTHGIEEELPTPEKEGYTFEGWYDNEDLEGEPVDKIDPEDIGEKEFYAKWEAKTDTAYKIEHYKQNTSLNGYDIVITDSENKTGTTGATVTATAKPYEGFSENATLSQKTGIIAGNGSLVLKVYYDRTTYQITLNTNGGNLPTGSENSNYTYGVEKELPIPEKQGYTFKGWYTNAQFEGQAVSKVNSNEIGEKSYFAKWEESTDIIYKVEHYIQTTSLTGYERKEEETKTGTVGQTVTALAKQYEGFTENKTHPNRLETGTVAANGSLVLRLYYDRNHYSIKLDPDGGTLPEGKEDIDYTYGVEEELPIPEKEDYIFGGWYDNEDLEGDQITTIKPTEVGDKTYYVKWIKADQYYITSEKYGINTTENYILKVSPNTNVTTFISNIKTNGIPKVVNAKKEEVKEDALVGTGYILQVDYKGTIYEYEIAVRGDLDGNGKITVTDLSVLNQVLVKKRTLTGIKEKAADIDYSGKITVTDLSMMNQNIVGKLKL